MACSLEIRLLGAPRILADGEVRRPRGRKAWLLLARVLLAERPPARRDLAAAMFAAADDPAAALRWSLAELRRALGRPDALRGDPVVAALGDVRVDALGVLDDGGPGLDDEALLAGAVLLDGIDEAVGPDGASWLLAARRRVAVRVDAARRQAVLRALALGDAPRALALAERGVAADPLDEGAHVLLVRALVAVGDQAGAAAQVGACEALFAAELGTSPSPALRSAARPRPDAAPLGVDPWAAAESQLAAGRAALGAGAVEAGLACLRRAVVDARETGDHALCGRTLLALGGALVHSLRGFDDEGSVALHQALAAARRAGDAATAAEALRELGHVEAMAGRRGEARRLLAEAADAAHGDSRLLAGVRGVQGLERSDAGDLAEAAGLLDESVVLALAARAQRQHAWSTALQARVALLRGDAGGAVALARRSLALADEQRWTSYRPWPAAIGAEAELAGGRPPLEVAEDMEHAYALSCQIGDPCWEGATGRVLALALLAGGRTAPALAWATEARRRALAPTDRYVWVAASALLAEAEAASVAGAAEQAESARTAALVLATRAEMATLVGRAEALGARTALA